MPKVSVIIPTFNRAEYICDAIDSVLAQTYHDLEIIVINDGSIDDTEKALKKYGGRIQYLYQNNAGVSAARNKGIKASRGEYIAFLDADDSWLPEKLSVQIPILEFNPKLGMVFSYLEIMDEYGRRTGRMKPKQKPGIDFLTMLEAGSAMTSSCLMRKRSLDAAGIFDESLAIYEDMDLFLRVVNQFPALFVEKSLGCYREHSNQSTLDDVKNYKQQVKLAQKWMQISDDPKAQRLLSAKVRKYSNLLMRNAVKKGSWGVALGYLGSFLFPSNRTEIENR
ncbi:MAG TPA: glycosyltransferase [Candidatus Omnitrophota bacterium]|nr:glycosyltransferase [Candidatus Omnitrophota bacterium]